jgi:hypothetical protein
VKNKIENISIKGTHESFIIIELNTDEHLYLQNIMEKELITYDEIFFKRKAFKKLGYKTLEELPIVAKISGFSSKTPNTLQYPTGVFTYFKNNKKVFVSTVDRLEERYHSGLYKEYCEIKSAITSNEFSFRKKKACKYFFLNIVQSGTFSFSVKDTFQLNQLLFKHSLNHFKTFYHPQVKLLEIQMDDSKLDFTITAKNQLTQNIVSV